MTASTQARKAGRPAAKAVNATSSSTSTSTSTTCGKPALSSLLQLHTTTRNTISLAPWNTTQLRIAGIPARFEYSLLASIDTASCHRREAYYDCPFPVFLYITLLRSTSLIVRLHQTSHSPEVVGTTVECLEGATPCRAPMETFPRTSHPPTAQVSFSQG
jgi:hypothetical protein